MAVDLANPVVTYPLLDALRDRRSRRFGRGMSMDSGPLTYQSNLTPLPLTEAEEALLVFAASGTTGPALADLNLAEGGKILAGLSGRTFSSGDAIHAASLIVINDGAAYLMKRPQAYAPNELGELVELAHKGAFTDLYRRGRIKIRDGRVTAPQQPMFNLPVNNWSLYDPAGTYFLPVIDQTFLHINGVLEIFDHPTCAFPVDERAAFRPAGTRAFAKSRGGHMRDDLEAGVTLTVQQIESLVTEFVTIEAGMMLQNLALMVQAMGLGGFPHWAAHPYGWLEALGFRMAEMGSDRYLGVPAPLALVARATGRTVPVPYATGLEVDGEALLAPFCPPNYPSMEAAVQALVELKVGHGGVFRQGTAVGGFRQPEEIAAGTPPPSEEAIEATIAYCEYLHDRYGRFPVYAPPFRTVVGFQVSHVDTEFYDRFYWPEALSDTQRHHLETWHRDDPTG